MRNWGAIFDVDGTMVDNAAFHESAWVELGRRRGFPITPEYYRTQLHARCNERIAKTLIGEHATADQIAGIADEKETIYRDSFRPYLREIPGLTALLQTLRAEGVRLAAASNSPRGNVDFVLDGLGIRAYFDSVIDRDAVQVGKPNPELFLRSADHLGLEAGRCVVFEDSGSGFRAACSAGMPYVVVTAGADPEQVRTAQDAAAIVGDFTEVTPELLHRIVNGRPAT